MIRHVSDYPSLITMSNELLTPKMETNLQVKVTVKERCALHEKSHRVNFDSG